MAVVAAPSLQGLYIASGMPTFSQQNRLILGSKSAQMAKYWGIRPEQHITSATLHPKPYKQLEPRRAA